VKPDILPLDASGRIALGDESAFCVVVIESVSLLNPPAQRANPEIGRLRSDTRLFESFQPMRLRRRDILNKAFQEEIFSKVVVVQKMRLFWQQILDRIREREIQIFASIPG
jgi:hypothetical protein